MDLKGGIKKFALGFGLASLFSCLSIENLPMDSVYDSQKTVIVNKNKSSNNLNNWIGFDFRYSAYPTSLGWDSDGDGIVNWNDPWKFQYGPFIDMNHNGIVDFGDLQIAGFMNPFFDNYAFYSSSFWGNPFLFDRFYKNNWFQNNFWFNLNNQNKTNKEFQYSPRKVHFNNFIPTKVPNNRRENTLDKKIEETRPERKINPNVVDPRNIRSTPIKKYSKPQESKYIIPENKRNIESIQNKYIKSPVNNNRNYNNPTNENRNYTPSKNIQQYTPINRNTNNSKIYTSPQKNPTIIPSISKSSSSGTSKNSSETKSSGSTSTRIKR